jgi:hypothetical protein
MEKLRVKNLIYRQVWLHPQGHRVRQDAPPPQPFRVGVFDASLQAGRWTFTPVEDFYSDMNWSDFVISAALRVCERSRNDFASFGRLSVRSDSLAEGSEFELPVPVCKLSDDSILLEFSTARRIASIAVCELGCLIGTS